MGFRFKVDDGIRFYVDDELQMQAYRRALAKILGLEAAKIDCTLVSTALKRTINICAV